MSSVSLGALFKRPVDPTHCLRLSCNPGAPEPPLLGKPRAVLLSRGLVLYRWLDLKNIPKGKRAAVAHAQLQAWSPFDEAAFRVVWFAQSAALFAWDRQRLADRLAAAGARPSLADAVIPEPWLVPPPTAGSAVRLVQGFDGFEGQVWQDASLRASRFWAELPENLDWLNFLRGASLAPAQLVERDAARVGQLPMHAEGWGPLLAPKDLQASGTRVERRLLWWGSLAMVAVSTVVAHGAWQQHRILQATEARLAILRELTAPVIKEREAALVQVARAEAVIGLLNRPEALAVLAHLITRLNSEPGILLREIDLNALSLRVTLGVPPTLSRSSLVKGLESGGWLVNVTEAAGAGSDLSLTMRLNGITPPEVKADEPSPAATVR